MVFKKRKKYTFAAETSVFFVSAMKERCGEASCEDSLASCRRGRLSSCSAAAAAVNGAAAAGVDATAVHSQRVPRCSPIVSRS